MALPVSLEVVTDELEALSEQMTAFVNRKTGEIATVSDDDLALAEEELNEEDLPAWQVEWLPKLREISEGEDWVALPGKFEIHEWEIMRRFADRVSDDALSDQLQRAIHGRGAFRMFRDTIERAGIRDQ